MALEVEIGVNPVLWMNDDLPSLGRETSVEAALASARRAGFKGVELSGRFPKEKAAQRGLLESLDLKLAAGWYSGELAQGSLEEELRRAEGTVDLLASLGAKVLVYGEMRDSIQRRIDLPLHKRPVFAEEEAWKRYGERLTAFARALFSSGLSLAYHPHMGAYVETPADVERLLSNSGPEVGLVVDSGHLAFARGDACQVVEKHAGRVRHVHLKDVRSSVLRMARNQRMSFLRAVLSGVFTVPGDGSLDFRRLLSALDRSSYKGWLIVEAEQDPAVAPGDLYAEKGFRHVAGLVRELQASPREAA